MTDFDWFIKVCDWEFDHLDQAELMCPDMDLGISRQAAAILLGLA
jgi:hypothetical protein